MAAVEKLVILKLNGDLQESGFQVTVEVANEGDRPSQEFPGSLPANPELAEYLQQWRKAYESLDNHNRAIKPKENVTDGLINRLTEYRRLTSECRRLADELRDRLIDWLDSPSFREAERPLRAVLNQEDTIRILIRTEDKNLHHFPWHFWSLIKDYSKAEIALGALTYRQDTAKKPDRARRVRILAILGNSTGINVEADRKLLNSFGATVEFLPQPSLKKISTQLWEQRWDILFFAGHSRTEGEQGRIYINEQDSLTIEELQGGLKQAIANGLKLAIFNSCDGLGLAYELEQLNIPQLIVMKEPVPDEVAQRFLKYFLTAYVGGESLYLSVRQARERLREECGGEFVCADWLPLIYQNPVKVPPLWDELHDLSSLTSAPIQIVFLISLVVTTMVMGLRWFGIIQPFELSVFDYLLKSLPAEQADPKILIVGADEEDLRLYKYPIPDERLAQVIRQLKIYKPHVIGLDIVRDQPVPPGHKAFTEELENSPNVITVCSFQDSSEHSIASVPKMQEAQVGFLDLPDEAVIRRYTLTRTSNPIAASSKCSTRFSFAFHLIYQYLKAKGIQVIPSDRDWRFGSITPQLLEKRSGGYQNIDARGSQFLINYRRTPEIAQPVTIRDVLNNNIEPDWVKDRIVLLGVTAGSVQDDIFTPYGRMRGITFNAHIISQLRSAVDAESGAVDAKKRSMLWWYPQWVDFLWVLGWSFTGGLSASYSRSSAKRIMKVGILLIILYCCCWGILGAGGWMPIIPSAIGLLLTQGSLAAYVSFKQRQHKFKPFYQRIHDAKA